MPDSTSSLTPFRNLIRFLDESSNELYGDVPEQNLSNIVGSEIKVLTGDFWDLKKTKKTAVVKTLLSPISYAPLIVCVGLNYADHAKEANLQVPPNPVIFLKPADALAGPSSQITVPHGVPMMDYEGELCVIISRDGKDIPENLALSYVYGYTAGNDLSSRYWQRSPRSGGQFSYAKSFDGFAPLGPTIRHPSSADPLAFSITTKVNGEMRQHASTADMIFTVQQIVAHVSRGTTLRRGTVIMTGTPAGIAGKMPGEPWLRDGDVVEVEIEGIGSLKNELVFQKE